MANENFAPNAEAQPARLIIEVSNPADSAIASYFQKKGYETEDGKLDASQIKSILSGGGLSTSKQPGRRVSVTLPPAFAPYFPPKATTKQIEETIQKALALYFKTMGNAS